MEVVGLGDILAIAGLGYDGDRKCLMLLRGSSDYPRSISPSLFMAHSAATTHMKRTPQMKRMELGRRSAAT